MMKRLFSFILLFCCGWQANASVVLISDIDDTLRQSNVRDLSDLEVLKNAEFAGLSTLYQHLQMNLVKKIEYVTGAPSIIKSTSEFFLSSNGFPAGKVHARALFKDTVTHKLEAIDKILQNSSLDTLILIGDNGEKDPLIYEKVSDQYSSDVIIFMHQLFDEEIPQTQLPWLTALDLSLTMYSLGMISLEAFDAVLSETSLKLESKDINEREKVFPKWAQCSLFFKNYLRPDVVLLEDQLDKLVKFEEFLALRCAS